jgi:hypothetical protein
MHWMLLKLITNLKFKLFRLGFNFFNITSIKSSALDFILQWFLVLIFKLVRLSFNFFINLDLILKGSIGLLEIINLNRYVISFADIILICIMKLILNFLMICELRSRLCNKIDETYLNSLTQWIDNLYLLLGNDKSTKIINGFLSFY